MKLVLEYEIQQTEHLCSSCIIQYDFTRPDGAAISVVLGVFAV